LEGDARSPGETEGGSLSVRCIALQLDVALARAPFNDGRRVVGAGQLEADVNTGTSVGLLEAAESGVPAVGAPESEELAAVDGGQAVSDGDGGVGRAAVHVLALEVQSDVLVAEVLVLGTSGEEENGEAGRELREATSEAAGIDGEFVRGEGTSTNELGASLVSVDEQGGRERGVREERTGLGSINGEIGTQRRAALEIILVVVQGVQQEVLGRGEVAAGDGKTGSVGAGGRGGRDDGAECGCQEGEQQEQSVLHVCWKGKTCRTRWKNAEEGLRTRDAIGRSVKECEVRWER